MNISLREVIRAVKGSNTKMTLGVIYVYCLCTWAMASFQWVISVILPPFDKYIIFQPANLLYSQISERYEFAALI